MTWQREFFEEYLRLEPDEALTLGVASRVRRLPDPSPEGHARRAELFTETVTRLERLDVESLTPNDALDRRTVLRHGAWEAFSREMGLVRRNPHWAAIPYTMARYEAALRDLGGFGDPAASSDLVAEVGALVPVFLDGLTETLRCARDDGSIAHRSQLDALFRIDLPAARNYFAHGSRHACDAYERFAAFLAVELLPKAAEHNLLGSQTYARGLALTHGVRDDLAALVAEAEGALRVTHEAMISALAELEPKAVISTIADVRTHLAARQRATLAPTDDIRSHYRAIIEKCGQYMAARGEFAPVNADEIGMSDYPEGMREMGVGTNWPVPLLSDHGRGQFVLHPDPSRHGLAWAPILAIHEGAPGHYSQSRGFRRHFGRDGAPVRFLCVADDVAVPRGNFLAMLNIEGYAVYAEERVRLAGFHKGFDELFALAARALRATRVIAEVKLHSGLLSRSEVDAFVALNACLPDAKWESERYLRGPFQAPSYYLGAREFDSLRSQVAKRRGANFDAAAFHEEVFSFGPVPPAEIGAALAARDDIGEERP